MQSLAAEMENMELISGSQLTVPCTKAVSKAMAIAYALLRMFCTHSHMKRRTQSDVEHGRDLSTEKTKKQVQFFFVPLL